MPKTFYRRAIEELNPLGSSHLYQGLNVNVIALPEFELANDKVVDERVTNNARTNSLLFWGYVNNL